MGRRYDDRRWVQNPDGSFTRRQRGAQPNTTELVEIPADPADPGDRDVIVNATNAAIVRSQELGVDLSQIDGSGLHGKITKGDVENAAGS